MERMPMLPEGRDRLKTELDHLKRFERLQVSQAIETAREHGDLRENAEYHAAKDKQGMIEARIRELESRLAMAQVIDPEKLGGSRISFGATVTLLDKGTNEELVYAIVGDEEADFKHGLISYKSPIARGILGKDEGDDVSIQTGNGTRKFEILTVEYKRIPLPPQA